jgi:hypothetical protein
MERSMGNPHPTKSKPNKIGRKHTGALSARKKALAEKNRRMHDKTLAARKHKRDRAVSAYFRGEADLHPPFT